MGSNMDVFAWLGPQGASFLWKLQGQLHWPSVGPELFMAAD